MSLDFLETRSPSRKPHRVRQPAACLPQPWRRGGALNEKDFQDRPLLCPKCGGPMKIKTFITDPREVDRIIKNLGLVEQRAPPSLNLRVSHSLGSHSLLTPQSSVLLAVLSCPAQSRLLTVKRANSPSAMEECASYGSVIIRNTSERRNSTLNS
jgi:hypothetical protein